jgi:hypothetical protein
MNQEMCRTGTSFLNYNNVGDSEATLIVNDEAVTLKSVANSLTPK